MTNVFNNARDVDISNATFNVHTTTNTIDHHSSNNPEFDLLLHHCALAALADAKERSNAPKCDPDTRREVMAEITNWITDDKATAEILWLHGSAGAGKTALGQTLADLCRDAGRLLGAFFFSRTGIGQGDGSTLVPTLAYQLTLAYPGSKRVVVKHIREDPGIFQKNMKTQMNKLVLTPLYQVQSSAPYRFKQFLGRVQPRVILVDGLDECSYPNAQCELLEVFVSAAQDPRLPLRILFTSRQEAHITRSVNDTLAHGRTPIKQIDLSTDPNAPRDIRTFLEKQFREIRRIHSDTVADSWPVQADVEQLVKKSSGQFIYAATVVDYIKSGRHSPSKRLQVVLGLSPRPTNDSPFSQLDRLYHHILSCIPRQMLSTALRIIGAIVAPRTSVGHAEMVHCPSPAMLECLLSLERGDVRRHLSDVFSLFKVAGRHDPVEVLHESLPDFFFDPTRSGDFFIDMRQVLQELSEGGSPARLGPSGDRCGE
ncbi:hypothetical protein NLJ89_g3906 [Agrocybe chaxingu]|uniref:Nephrocystin 3-like N-terminal domain-containing protein n=1 Tax=Agrocybe chaxingu TaxID=84603 RepID=A0A9W8K4V6_9AGAR|nr:hypothetical protein NLJ89_g3906 [Agrocybe chaxingu]